MRLAAQVACAVTASSLSCAGFAADVVSMERLDVVAATPLPGANLDAGEMAAPVQTATAERIDASKAVDVSSFLQRFFAGVHVNDMQGNPFQPDINYRGFTASPVLGTAQGLSVYLDGVRLNQPFGDVVSWDVIPRAAIASMALMPGSNPLFGLNTLGGALAIQTKDGLTHPGTSVQGYYGSNARWATEFEHGGSDERGLDWYVTGNFFREHGWRDDSPSRVGQLFAKAGWRNDTTHASFTAAYADTNLTGNGLQEIGLLERGYSSVYTRPDTTTNRALFLNLLGTHDFDDTRSFSGGAYFRHIDTATLNGDVNNDALGDPDEARNALLNRTRTKQDNYGLSGQLAWNRFVAGAAYDASKVQFLQSAQFGYLDAARSVVPVDEFVDDARVDLDGRSHTWSAFASDTLAFGSAWNVTLSGRYNNTTIHNRDRIAPGGGPGSLDSDSTFARFNPALGITFAPAKHVIAYAGIGEGSRAPSSIELGCADPGTPCKLPNAMAGDPPLKQVVARTYELGVRGESAGSKWNLGVFRADSEDDILFVAADQTGFGYFRNFGKTRRQGIEAGLSGRAGAFSFGANYTYLDATYRSDEVLAGFDGSIPVHAGDRIPLVPRSMAKIFSEIAIGSKISVNADLQAYSSSVGRANRATVPRYAVVNLGADYRPTPALRFFVQVDNLFDTRYYTAAQVGATAFNAQGEYVGQGPVLRSTFYAPGAERALRIGVRYTFR